MREATHARLVQNLAATPAMLEAAHMLYLATLAGAEALGAALAAVALVSGHALLLLVSGIAMVSEAVSDIVQVGYFKYTRRRYGEGRRVFRMAPLHHHFEALGMDEVQVTTRFWIATAVASFLAVAVRGVH